MKAEKMGPEEGDLDAPSLQMTYFASLSHLLFDWSTQHDFIFVFFSF